MVIHYRCKYCLRHETTEIKEGQTQIPYLKSCPVCGILSYYLVETPADIK
jgi:hypothetical protein